MWQVVSDFLMNCKYKPLKDTEPSKHGKLKTFNLNIRSLWKHIDKITEISETLNFFDVLWSNQTSCDVNKLTHGINDILIEHFYPPTVKLPYRQ